MDKVETAMEKMPASHHEDQYWMGDSVCLHVGGRTRILIRGILVTATISHNKRPEGKKYLAHKLVD